MSKRKQKRLERQLVAELIRFLRTGKRKSITIQEYFELTDAKKQWTLEKKSLLYSGLERTKALSIAKSQHEKLVTMRDLSYPREYSITVTYTRLEVTLLT
jgi:hypothetical protein